jgi:hypothetical protein
VCGSERTARGGGGSTSGGSASVHLGRAIFAGLSPRVGGAGSPRASGPFPLQPLQPLTRAAELHQPPLPAPQSAGLPGIGPSAPEGSGMLSSAATVVDCPHTAVARGGHYVLFMYTREAHPRGTADLC